MTGKYAINFHAAQVSNISNDVVRNSQTSINKGKREFFFFEKSQNKGLSHFNIKKVFFMIQLIIGW